ncbi:GHKL domain-containing protein [Kordia sp. YSTF-M3]|uniref:histidine kinase n=1 Tax=Kordia aestuariivivens TaxID=2759037 RepID=A0ABR7Q912_9FLAO|nr:ATP-binding protein [Kordia aestuariivivens]MBC8755028.1 GHKL domain-containing protein [Kordia aestuariivivens]
MLFSIPNSFGFVQSNENDIAAIDLQNTTIDKTTEIALNAGWEFYWKEFIEPGNFNAKKPLAEVTLTNWTKFNLSETEKLPSFGYATYRLQISIPKERPHVSLYIPAAYASSKLWVNGKLIAEIGRVGTSKAETLHRRAAQILPLNTDETEFEIVIHVANFYHNKGGIDEPPILGFSNLLHDIRSKEIIADMIFIGCLGFIGIFFLLFFLFYWNKDKAILYFAILCMSLSYMALSDRYAPFAEIFESMSWILLTKIEYIILFLAGVSASLFFYTIFSNFVHKPYSKIIVYSFYFLALLVVFLPAPYFTELLLPFLLLMILNLIYVTFVIVKAVISNRHESLLMLVSMLLGSIIFYVHIFSFLGESGNAMIYVNFGYIVVFLLLSMLLMTRFSNSFQELERTKEVALAQKKEISIQSNKLSTVNRELKENLRHLENSNAELDSFNHIVSHDLKAPLIAMHTLVSFIEEDLEMTINEDAKQHFKLLKDRVSKMDALINGLLEYSKIAKGKKKKESFGLNNLLREIIEVVDNENKHTIHLPEKDAEIYANKIELEHVFQNLINNAIKHNDKNNAIITISFSKLPNEYLFSVSDNGPGIDVKYHTKIFEMFSQLNFNDEVESTGIGLSIVKKIVSENHGTISVESEKGIGTTIKFSWRT